MMTPALEGDQKRRFDLALDYDHHFTATGGGPYLTRDPLVNWLVDNELTGQLVPYDADLYVAEIAAWEESGGNFLEDLIKEQ